MLVNPNFTNDDILFESEIDSSLSSSSRRPVENKAITEALKGKSDVNHSHLLKDITDFPTYLEPLFKQNTWYSVGDDSYIGSHGVSGGLGLLGNNGITKLDFCKQDEPEVYKSITFDGTTLNVDGNCEYAKTAGNANTVGGLSPYHVATLDESGNSQGNSLQFYCKFNKFGDNRYGLGINSITDYQIRVDHASTADALSNINSGSSIQPVFFSGGIPVSCSYTIEKSVPSDALFTDTTYTEATTTKAGLLSPTDKAKLDSIIEGANKIEIDSTITNTSSNPVQSNAIYEALAGKANTIHSHDDIYYTESEIDDILKNKLDVTLKGASNGLAELDSNGKVPSTQLPSYVDDVIEGYYNDNKFYEDASFTTEVIGEAGKIYVDISTNKTYRWTGSIFNVISETISLGETSSTAYRGDRGKIAYDHSQADHARTDATKVEGSTTNGNIKIDGLEVNVYTHPEGTNPHGTTKSDVGLSNVDNTADIDKNVLSASKWTTERTISLEGAITGSASIDGSGNVVLTTSEGDLSFKRKTTDITNVTDWNTIQDPGAYPVNIGSVWGSSSTYHSPNEYRSDVYRWGILLVFRTGSSSIPAITQIYIPDGGAYQILYRQAYGGTDKWKSWSPMYKGITKQDVGLNNVENKSSETIRSEITSENVKTALGYTPLESIPYATAKPLVAGTASIGTSTNVAREDHVHPAQISVSGSSGSCRGNAASASKLSPILAGAVGNQKAEKYYYIGKFVTKETEWQGIECTMKFVDSTNKIFDSEIRLIIRHNGTSNNWLRINCFEESLYNLYGRFHIIQISTTEIQIWYQFPPDANDYINPRLYLICGNITNLQLTTTPDATYDELPEGTDKVSKPIPYGSVRIENESPLDLFSNSLDSTHFCWNKKCYVWGQSTDPTADRYIDNAPETYSVLWYEVETIGNYGSDDLRGYQIAHGCMSHQRKSFIRYNQGGTWSEWRNIADGGTSYGVLTPNGKAHLYEDNEGGNLSLVAPDGVHCMEMDLYNNESFRMYFGDGTQLYFPVEYNFNTGKFNINGNADTVDGLHASDFAYMTDIVKGLRYGYASASTGTIMTYGDRKVVKTSNKLSYFGWTDNSDGWFSPIIVSRSASGTNYTMWDQNCGYDSAAESERATFEYKNRTYYACWSSPGSYQSPVVTGGLHLTVTNNDYVAACKTLIDICESTNADEFVSNPNLLINPDFKINQRGSTTYTNSTLTKYSVDRWIYAGSCTPSSTGVTVSADGSGYGYGLFVQRLENYISGQIVTVSAKVNGSIYQFTGNTSEKYLGGDRDRIKDSDGNDVGCIRMSNDGNINAVEFIIYEGCQMEIEWAKLEYGSVATPFIPPDPAIELPKCQRFYYSIRGVSSSEDYFQSFGSGMCINTNRALINLPIIMRTTPTINRSSLALNTTYIVSGTSGAGKFTTYVGITSISARAYEHGIKFLIDTSSVGDGLALGSHAVFVITAPREGGGYFELDAEIY